MHAVQDHYADPILDSMVSREIIIDNRDNSSEHEDYQSMLEVDNNHLLFGGQDGLRFVDANMQLIDYWNESFPDKIWLELPNVRGSAMCTVRMFEGEPSSEAESNGTNTFEFFDDFEDAGASLPPTSGDATVSADVGKYEAWPAIAKNSAGDLFVVYRTCDSNTHGFDSSGRVVIRKSTDNGETWGSEVVVANAANIDDRTAGSILIFDDNGTETILVSYFEHTSVGDSYTVYAKKSVDNGVNWGAKIALSGANKRATGGGTPILLSNGKILIPIYMSIAPIGTYVVESNDGGDTWTEYTVSTSTGSEFAIAETKTSGSYTGGIYGLIRDDSSPYAFKKAISTDYGHTWGSVSDETDLPVDRAVPVVLFRLSNDNIVAVYSRDSGGVVYESSDECVNWTYKKNWLGGRTEGTYNSYYPVIEQISDSNLIIAWCTNGDSGGSEVSDVYVNFEDYPFVDHLWVNLGTGSGSISGGIATISAGANKDGVCTKNNMSLHNFILEFELKPNASVNSYQGVLSPYINGTNNDWVFIQKSGATWYDGVYHNDSVNGADTYWEEGTARSAQFYNYKVVRKGSEGSRTIVFYENGIEIIQNTFDDTGWGYGKLALVANPSADYDNVLIRKYTSPEPTAELGVMI